MNKQMKEIETNRNDRLGLLREHDAAVQERRDDVVHEQSGRVLVRLRIECLVQILGKLDDSCKRLK